jgi:hypothetical protein
MQFFVCLESGSPKTCIVSLLYCFIALLLYCFILYCCNALLWCCWSQYDFPLKVSNQTTIKTGTFSTDAALDAIVSWLGSTATATVTVM